MVERVVTSCKGRSGVLLRVNMFFFCYFPSRNPREREYAASDKRWRGEISGDVLNPIAIETNWKNRHGRRYSGRVNPCAITDRWQKSKKNKAKQSKAMTKTNKKNKIKNKNEKKQKQILRSTKTKDKTHKLVRLGRTSNTPSGSVVSMLVTSFLAAHHIQPNADGERHQHTPLTRAVQHSLHDCRRTQRETQHCCTVLHYKSTWTKYCRSAKRNTALYSSTTRTNYSERLQHHSFCLACSVSCVGTCVPLENIIDFFGGKSANGYSDVMTMILRLQLIMPIFFKLLYLIRGSS